MLLDAYYPPCSIITRDAISCCPTTPSNEASLTDRSAYNLSSCEANLTDTGHPATCDEHKHQTIHDVHNALICIVASIVAIFILESIVLLVTLRGVFFRNPLYILDLVILPPSLAIAIQVALSNDSTIAILGEFMPLLRIWRLVRIGVKTSVVSFGPGSTGRCMTRSHDYFRCSGTLSTSRRLKSYVLGMIVP